MCIIAGGYESSPARLQSACAFLLHESYGVDLARRFNGGWVGGLIVFGGLWYDLYTQSCVCVCVRYMFVHIQSTTSPKAYCKLFRLSCICLCGGAAVVKASLHPVRVEIFAKLVPFVTVFSKTIIAMLAI